MDKGNNNDNEYKNETDTKPLANVFMQTEPIGTQRIITAHKDNMIEEIEINTGTTENRVLTANPIGFRFNYPNEIRYHTKLAKEILIRLNKLFYLRYGHFNNEQFTDELEYSFMRIFNAIELKIDKNLMRKDKINMKFLRILEMPTNNLISDISILHDLKIITDALNISDYVSLPHLKFEEVSKNEIKHRAAFLCQISVTDFECLATMCIMNISSAKFIKAKYERNKK